MGLFHRAHKTDLRDEVNQLRELRKELASVTAELNVTTRILRSKVELVQSRDDEDGHDD